MKQIQLSSVEKQSILTNINVFLFSDSNVVDQICIKNVANILFNVIKNSYDLLTDYFPQQFILDIQKQYNIAFDISVDFFLWIKTKNIDSKSAIDNIEYNIGQFIQAYQIFMNEQN